MFKQLSKRFVEDFSTIPENMRWYIAGIIDGEGYIGILKKIRKDMSVSTPYYYDPVVKIASTNVEVMDVLEKYLGGYRFLVMRNKLLKNDITYKCKDAHSLEWKSGSRILPMLKWIYPCLIIKKDMCKLCIDFLEWKNIQKRYGSLKHKPYSEEEKDIMENFYQKCKQINHRGTAVETK